MTSDERNSPRIHRILLGSPLSCSIVLSIFDVSCHGRIVHRVDDIVVPRENLHSHAIEKVTWFGIPENDSSDSSTRRANNSAHQLKIMGAPWLN